MVWQKMMKNKAATKTCSFPDLEVSKIKCHFAFSFSRQTILSNWIIWQFTTHPQLCLWLGLLTDYFGGVCARDRERERESVCVSVCVCGSGSVFVMIFMYVRVASFITWQRLSLYKRCKFILRKLKENLLKFN